LVYSGVLIFGCALILSACKATPAPSTNESGQPALIAAATPPFATREPERYQAVRTITSSEGAGVSRTSKTLIFRDGLKRREEYQNMAGGRIVYLELQTGRFVLLPAAKLFADVVGGSALAGNGQPSPDEVSTDFLLNQAPVETRYERLGTENVRDRAATKFRVLTRSMNGAGSDTQTLIWIDETLGMPLRWETTASSDEHEKKTTMELSEIKLDIERSVFDIPADYRKVDIRSLLGYAPNGQPVAPKN